MKKFFFNDKEYDVDEMGFLIEPKDWDENFAEGIALETNIPLGLTDEHWEVIRFIRNEYVSKSECPLVFSVCKNVGISIRELQYLFPAGYERGACKLAGISYRSGIGSFVKEKDLNIDLVYDASKLYRIDILGFLVDSDEWDERFAINKAFELKMPQNLTNRHWKIIYYIRNIYKDTGSIPTVYETCENNDLTIEQLEQLFPDGYHRGAVKLAGLRLLN